MIYSIRRIRRCAGLISAFDCRNTWRPKRGPAGDENDGGLRASKINLSPVPIPHEMMRSSAPEKGSRVDRNVVGGAERCPRSGEVSDLSPSGRSRRDRRHYDRPPQGLNPAQMRGEAPAGRREENRRGGRSASAPKFRGVTARHSPGARHPPCAFGLAGEFFERFDHPEPIARGNGRACHSLRSLLRRREREAGCLPRGTCSPGRPVGAGHERESAVKLRRGGACPTASRSGAGSP